MGPSFDGEDLLAPMVDVAFDLGNLAFIGIDGGNNANFCLTDISNLKGFGSINHTVEGIGGVTEFEAIAARKIGFMATWKSKIKIRRFAKKY